MIRINIKKFKDFSRLIKILERDLSGKELEKYRANLKGFYRKYFLCRYVWLPIFNFALWGMGESYAKSLIYYMETYEYKNKP